VMDLLAAIALIVLILFLIGMLCMASFNLGFKANQIIAARDERERKE